MMVSSMALVAVWGERVFAPYAAAMGAFTFVIPMVNFGVEKSALKLVPRATATKPLLVGGLVVASTLLALPFVAWLVAAYLVTGHVRTLELGVGLLSVALGLNQVVVALQRALGRPKLDVVNFVVLATTTAVFTLLAAFVDLRPVGFVLLMLATAMGLNVWLFALLPDRSLGLFGRRALRRSIAQTMALMGISDVARGLSISALFVVLAVSAFAAEASDLFVTMTVAAIAFGFFEYVLRVFQPQVALELARGGRATAHRNARRLVRLVVAFGSAYLLALSAAAIAAARTFDPSSIGLPHYTLVLAFFVASLPLFLATGIANFLLENVDPRSLRVAATSSLAALAATVTFALVLVPLLGAVGAVAALAAGQVFQALVVLDRLATIGRRSAQAARAGLPA